MAEPEQDDKNLVRRMLAGEDIAFGEFFDGHFPRLYRFALARVGLDADAAEEVVQAALCKAIPALKSWRGEGALFNWLCTFCRHEISGHFRRAGREPRAAGLIETVSSAPDALVSLADRLERTAPGDAGAGDVSRQVHEALDRLPPRHADALEMKYIEGLTVEEIAARLGLGAKAVESLLTRARLSFRRAFEAEEKEDA